MTENFKHNCKYRESFYVHQNDHTVHYCHHPHWYNIPLRKRCVEKECEDWIE